MRNFNLRLNRVLEAVDPTADPTAANPATDPNDPTKTDPALKKQQADAETKGGVPDPAAAKGGKPDPAAAKAEQDKQKQKQQGSQLNLRMADIDKQTQQLQAKISSSAAKPADIAKLNQLLTAKKAIQDQLLKTFGLSPT